MSHSQNDEEAQIRQQLTGSVCRFLDIGAHDGVTFSNTKSLADVGWSGTLVEPSPAAFVALMKTYEGRKDVNLVHAAVVAEGPSRMVQFHDSRGDMVSTLSEAHRELWVKGSHVTFQPIHVAALSVAALIEQFPGPYSLLNLDVEGTNHELFQALSLRDLGVEVACVEYQDKLPQIVARATEQGYRQYHKTSENVLFVVNR